MAFQVKNWLNTGDDGANDDNSVVNKTTLNDLENRIKKLETDILNRLNKFDEFEETTNDIPSNADLNSYTEVGVYRCPSASIATTLKNNIPINCAYRLTVKHLNTISAVRQIIETNQTDCKTYMRYHNSNGWYDWQLISTTKIS